MSDRILIVGAGIGGLAAALDLAADGHAVTLFEAAAQPGGKARTLPSSAGPVQAGPTVLTLRPVFDALFADAGLALSDHVRTVREPLLARHFWADGGVLDLVSDDEANADAIARLSGAHDARTYRRFSAAARRLFDAFEGPVMTAPAPSRAGVAAAILRRPRLALDLAPWATLDRRLAAFRDPRLRQLFGRYATYVGGAPDRSPALLSLVWEAERRGVWRVDGGVSALAAALADAARAKGAEIRLSAPVARIETDGARVTGLVAADGTRHAADRVIFAGDPRALSQGHLGPDATRATAAPATAARSLSARVWAFAATADGPDLAHHNVFFADRPNAEFPDIRAGRMPRDPTLYLCAQDRGAGRAVPAGDERFEIIENAAPGDAPPDTDEEKDACRTRTFARLARFGLRLLPAPDLAALTTPGDFAALYPGSAGSLYGQSPSGLTAAFARPTARTAIPGLYLAGGGAHPGAGVPMAAISGRLAAAAIRTDRASTSPSHRTAMPGGTSTDWPTTTPAPSRSSPSSARSSRPGTAGPGAGGQRTTSA